MKIVPTPSTARAVARNPVSALRGEQRVPATVLLFAGLVALNSYRRGRARGQMFVLPKDQEWIPILIAAAVIAVAANIAPDVVTLLLIAAAIVTILQDADGIAKLIATGTGQLQAALAGAGVRL